MRKTLTLASLIAAALVLAGPAARAITYPPAVRACASQIIVALDHIKTLRRNPALNATASARAAAAKANALMIQDSHVLTLVYHKLTRDPAFRHSPAATHIVCQIARAFRADQRILAFAAAPAHAPAPAPRRAARGVQGQLGLHPRALGGGGATQITRSYTHGFERSRSIQHTRSETHTHSITHSHETSRSISHERSETRSRTLSHTLSRGRTHSRSDTESQTFLCEPSGWCPRTSTQAYEAGLCNPPMDLSCPDIDWKAVRVWWRGIRRRRDASHHDASGSPYAHREDKIFKAAPALWPAPAGASIGGVVKLSGDKRQMRLSLVDGSVWTMTRLPHHQIATVEIHAPARAR
jgi:hypothetical protein